MYIWRRHNFSQINRPRKTVKFSDISYQTSSTNCQTIRFFTELVPAEVTVRQELIVGIPRDEIVRAASQRNADWIIMGTHGRRGLERWVMGSTAELVVRHAPCPVLVVRQTGP